MPRLMFSVDEDEAARFGPPILQACRAAGVEAEPCGPDHPPEQVDYVVLSPAGPVRDFSRFTRLSAALSLWAGVERLVGNRTLAAPLCRMVDPGLTEGMTEYVAGHALRYHLGLDAVLAAQDGDWRPELVPPLARERPVGVLGLGALGAACAAALSRLGFRVCGWSRRPRKIDGIDCRHGEVGLGEVLRRAEILVTLLPETPATENLLDATRLALLPPGARLINPGRGTLIDDEALLAALDTGALAHATLDVFRNEPLPPGHRFWSHPRITVTPHIAAATRPATAAPVIAENIRRAEAGLELLHLVDRDAGY
jgi:glyoxylate/hydroxypyruvate reductase